MTPQENDALQRVVAAGMKIMFDPKTFPMLKAGVSKEGPMPEKLAQQAVGLLKLLQDRANGSIPRQILIPAAMMLMLEVGRTIHDMGMPSPTPEDVQAAYKLLVPLVAKEFPKGGQAAPAVPPPAAPPAPQPGLLAQGA